MVRRVAYRAATVIGVAVALAGCGFGFFGYEQRAAWRDREERVCMASRPPVVFSAWVQPERRIDGRGACGIAYPLKVSALQDGAIRLDPAPSIGCPMTTVLETWLQEAVQPAALAWFGAPVVEIRHLSAYACRTRNSEPGAALSEHAFGNALDVAGFTLADGRSVTVKADWNGRPEARGFLREVFAAACQRFKTVLGPGVKYHGDHFHLDLAHHGRDGTSRYCRPTPTVEPPNRQPWRGGLFARNSNLDWMRTGSVEQASDVPADVRAGLADPFGVSRLNPGIDDPAYAEGD